MQQLQMNPPWECELISLINSYLAFSFFHFSTTKLLKLGVYKFFKKVKRSINTLGALRRKTYILWTGPLFWDGVKKSRGEGRKKPFPSLSSRFFHPFPKQRACSQATRQKATKILITVWESSKLPTYPTPWRRVDIVTKMVSFIECFHMTSQRPYRCPKTMKRRPCWCPKPILRELYSFLMQTLSFVPRNLHWCWPRRWKHSILTLCTYCTYSEHGF